MRGFEDVDPGDLSSLSDERFGELLRSITTLATEDRKENQILYYRPASKAARKIHYSTAKILGIGGGNRASKTETALVDMVALSTGIFPQDLTDAFAPRFKGPLNLRVVCQSLKTVLHPIILPKLRWWKWLGIDREGGERGHYGWVPKNCLRGGEWDKSWSEKLHTLTFKCRNPDNHDEIIGESQIQFMCLRGDQRVLRPNDEWTPIKDLRVGDRVSHPSGKPSKVLKVFEYGCAPLYQIRTPRGREIVATANHRHFLSDGSLKRTDQLTIDDVLAFIPQSDHLGEPGDPLPDWLLGWTAVGIGDGCLLRKDFSFTATEGSRVLCNLPPMPPDCRLAGIPSNENEHRIWLTKGRRNNPIVMALKDYGLWGKRSHEKFVPGEIFNQPRDRVAYFLRHLWNCDGTINQKGRQACYTTISRQLAFDVKYLLWSLGIPATTGDVTGRCGFTGREISSFHTVVSGGSFDRFVAAIEGGSFTTIQVNPRRVAGKVDTIQRMNDEPVYCIEVDADDHAFIVDGLVTHNSYDQDAEDFRSGTFDIILHDEPPPYPIWLENQARVMDVDGRLMVAMTWPDDPAIPVDWIHDEVYEPGQDKNDPDVEWHEFYTTDNVHLDPKITAARMARWSKEMQNVRIFGRPIRFSSLIHKLFTDRQDFWCFKCHETTVPDEHGNCTVCGTEEAEPFCHVQDFEHFQGWPVIYLLDPHPRKPHMMCWVVVDPSDDYWVVAEAETPADPEEVKVLVDEIEGDMGLNVQLRLMDPNMGASPASAKHKISWQEEFQNVGLYCDLADDSDVGRGRVNEYLKPDQDTMRVRLTVHERCHQVIHQMKRYAWDNFKKAEERDIKQRPKPKNDDYPTLLKYLMNYLPVFSALHQGPRIISRPGTRRGAY